jgi:hypothetical protein
VSDPKFLDGVRLLRAREYFEGHDVLERIWAPMPPGPDRDSLQVVIQLAVALEHLRRGNANGCFALWNKAKGKQRKLPDWSAEGLGVGPWLEAVGAFLTEEASLADRVRAQLEGGVAADAEAGHMTDLPALPPGERWPVPPVSEALAALL